MYIGPQARKVFKTHQKVILIYYNGFKIQHSRLSSVEPFPHMKLSYTETSGSSRLILSTLSDNGSARPWAKIFPSLFQLKMGSGLASY